MDKNLANMKLDLNTKEGWNEHVRQGNIKTLIRMGIEPTEENLTKYQEEVNNLCNEQLKKMKIKPIPIRYTYKNNEISRGYVS